LYSYSN